MVDEKLIQNEIEQGVAQVDPDLTVTDFVFDLDPLTRKLKVYFKANSQNGDTVEVSNIWG